MNLFSSYEDTCFECENYKEGKFIMFTRKKVINKNDTVLLCKDCIKKALKIIERN